MHDRIYVLDLVKVGLLLTIFICHTSFLLPPVVNDWFGHLTKYVLELFFIISGFLSAKYYYNDQPINTFIFIKKKIVTIYPTYFIGYLLCFIYQFLSDQLADISVLIKTSIVNLLFLQSWTYNETYVYSFNGVSWFISSLMFCFLLTPISVKLLKKVELDKFLWFIMGIIVIRFIYLTYFDMFISVGNFCYTNVFPPYRFLEYLCGLALGVICSEKKDSIFIKVRGIQVYGFVLFFLAFHMDWLQNGRFDPIFIFFELFLIYSLTSSEGVLTKISKLRIIGYLSSINLYFFLLHQVVIKFIRLICDDTFVYNYILWWILLLLITIGVCTMFHYSKKYLYNIIYRKNGKLYI